MIVIVIIGILVTIAFPAYQNYVTRTKRSDAKVALLALQQAMEKYRANCPQYATGINTTTRTCTSGGTHNLVGKTTSEKSYYNLTLSNVTSTTYTLTATASSTSDQKTDTSCVTFSINQDGLKTSTATGGTAPGTTDTNNCWK